MIPGFGRSEVVIIYPDMYGDGGTPSHPRHYQIILSYCNYHDDYISSTKTGCFIARRFEVHDLLFKPIH